MFSVRFWGVRGTIPRPGQRTVLFGGNTSCLEIRAENRLIIVDAGSGIKPLGDQIVKDNRKKDPIDADIFISHTHVDHILGFMNFVPAYIPSTTLRVYGPKQLISGSIRNTIDSYNTYQFWPVDTHAFHAKMTYTDLTEGILDLGGGLKVTAKYLNHPVVTLGYRFEFEGKSIVTAFDSERYVNYFESDSNASSLEKTLGAQAAEKENAGMMEFIAGADILICDGQYTAKEYQNGKKFWGHSIIEDDIENAKKAEVKKLLIFHHDPAKTDEQLNDDEKNYCYSPENKLQTIFAREGMTVEA